MSSATYDRFLRKCEATVATGLRGMCPTVAKIGSSIMGDPPRAPASPAPAAFADAFGGLGGEPLRDSGNEPQLNPLFAPPPAVPSPPISPRYIETFEDPRRTTGFQRLRGVPNACQTGEFFIPTGSSTINVGSGIRRPVAQSGLCCDTSPSGVALSENSRRRYVIYRCSGGRFPQIPKFVARNARDDGVEPVWLKVTRQRSNVNFDYLNDDEPVTIAGETFKIQLQARLDEI